VKGTRLRTTRCEVSISKRGLMSFLLRNDVWDRSQNKEIAALKT
jgi:hypothetical protein